MAPRTVRRSGGGHASNRPWGTADRKVRRRTSGKGKAGSSIPPPSNSFYLLEDGTSYYLMEDGVSKYLME